MARQGTAKDAILAKQAQPQVTPQTTPEVTTSPANAVAQTSPVATPTPSPTPAPRVEGQWNYGTAENQVLGQVPTPIQTPTPVTPASEKPKTASEAIAQGFKQELKPPQAPITTEIGREQRLGQLPVTTAGANIEEQNRINEQNLKNASGKQLWDNMNTISTGNSKLLTDRKAFDQAFGYEGKDAGEKALVDAFWKSKQPSTSDLYNALATNSDIPATAKNTPWYNDALLRHQDVTRFENLNPYTLSKVIGTELIPGTQTYNDLLAKNPKLVQDANKLASINTPVTAREEKPNWQDVLSGYLTRSPAMQNPNTVATIMNSDPAIATKTNEVQAIEDKLTEAKNRLQNIKANVTERYKGTGATSATINAKALSESRDITNEITMLEANKASASGALTTLIQNAKDNYTFARQDKLDAENRFNQGFQQLQAMAEMGMKQDSVEYQKQQDAVNRDLALMQYYTNIDQANMRDELGFQRDLSKMDLQQQYGVQNDLRNFEQQKQLAQMGYQNQAYLQDRQFGQQAGLQSQAQQMDMLKTLLSQGVPYNDAVAQLSGQTVNQTALGDLNGAELMKVLASGNLNGKKFFGVYATGDMTGDNRANIYKTAEREGLDAFVSKYKGTQITPEMINIAAQKTGVDPLMIATILAADSSMGTKGLGAKNNNPGNVGQFDSLGTQGVKGYATLQDGVNAAAENLSKRMDSLISILPKANQATTQTTSTYLPPKIASRVDSYVKDFEAEPIVKQYNTVRSQVGAFQNYMKDTSGSNDQAMVYAFAKIMDPESVVREGEYETVKKYSQSLLSKWKGEIQNAANGSGFLSQGAKDAMLGTIQKGKLKALENEYNNFKNERVRQINQITGKDNGDTFLVDYAATTPTQISQNSPVYDAAKARLEALKASRNK